MREPGCRAGAGPRHGVSIALLAIAVGVACGRSSTTPSPQSQFGPVSTLAEAPVSDALVNVTAGSTDTDNFPGQSLDVPSGTFGSLRFNWYRRDRTEVAFGTLYLLAQEYLGLAKDLPQAQGLIARSVSSTNGEYVFPPEVSVTGARRYWFYADTQGSFANSFDLDVYAGGDAFNSSIHTLPFRKSPASGRYTSFNPPVFVPAPPGLYIDNNFRLRGAAVR